jgi:hypothetical protein
MENQLDYVDDHHQVFKILMHEEILDPTESIQNEEFLLQSGNFKRQETSLETSNEYDDEFIDAPPHIEEACIQDFQNQELISEIKTQDVIHEIVKNVVDVIVPDELPDVIENKIEDVITDFITDVITDVIEIKTEDVVHEVVKNIVDVVVPDVIPDVIENKIEDVIEKKIEDVITDPVEILKILKDPEYTIERVVLPEEQPVDTKKYTKSNLGQQQQKTKKSQCNIL